MDGLTIEDNQDPAQFTPPKQDVLSAADGGHTASLSDTSYLHQVPEDPSPNNTQAGITPSRQCAILYFDGSNYHAIPCDPDCLSGEWYSFTPRSEPHAQISNNMSSFYPPWGPWNPPAVQNRVPSGADAEVAPAGQAERQRSTDAPTLIPFNPISQDPAWPYLGWPSSPPTAQVSLSVTPQLPFAAPGEPVFEQNPIPWDRRRHSKRTSPHVHPMAFLASTIPEPNPDEPSSDEWTDDELYLVYRPRIKRGRSPRARDSLDWRDEPRRSSSMPERASSPASSTSSTEERGTTRSDESPARHSTVF